MGIGPRSYSTNRRMDTSRTSFVSLDGGGCSPSRKMVVDAIFQEAWDTVHDKTTVTSEEVERAAVLGSELHIALGLRRVGADLQSKPPESQLTRDRAFTLFVRAYDEVRRGVTFLRWYEGDVDSYAPSLYARGPRRVPTQPEGSPGASPTPTTELPPTAALAEPPPSTEPALSRT